MTTDHSALIAEARQFAIDHRRRGEFLAADRNERLADALEQVTAELQQKREDHRSAHDALVFMAIELGWATDGRLATAVGHAKEVLRARTAERDAAYTAIREALEDIQPSRFVAPHGMGHEGTTRNVVRARAILSRIPTEEASK